MHSRLAQGEVILALLFAALGMLWVVTAFSMPFWQGFAPESGFVPFWYGIILVGLSAAIIVNLVRGTDAATTAEPVRKPLIVLVALAGSIVGLEVAGFGPAIFLLLLFLFVVIEKLPLARSVIVAAATAGVLLLIFKVWLRIPLPIGPLGF